MIRTFLALLLLTAVCRAEPPDNFGVSAPPNGTVFDVAQQVNGGIIVVGDFNKAGTISRARIARYTISGDLDAGFTVGIGANDTIHEVEVTEDDEIVIAGDFTSYQGNPATHGAVLNADGSFKRSLGLPTPLTRVHALKVAGGSVYVGGDFPGYYKEFNLLGGYSLPIQAGSLNGVVRAICVDDVPTGPFITLGGDFTRIGGTSVGHIAHLSREGRLLETANQHAGANGPIHALDILPGRHQYTAPARIVATGAFTTFNGSSRDGIVAIYGGNPGFSSPQPGSLYGSLGSFGVPPINGTIDSISIQPGGFESIVLGGDFTITGSTRRNLIFASLAGWFNLGPDSDHMPNQPVHGLLHQLDGMLVVGGAFTQIDGLNRSRLARYYGPLGDNPPAAPSIDIVYPMDDDSILIEWEPTPSAYFNHYEIQRMTLNGSWTTAGHVSRDQWRFFDRGLNQGTRYIYRILAQSGTGAGISTNGTTVTKVPPVGGTPVPEFDTSAHSTSSISTIRRVAVDARQRILAAETRSFPEGEPSGIFRFLPDGSIDPGFEAEVNGGTVDALAILPDGRTMIGGRFQQVSGSTKPHLARLLEDGTTDPGYFPEPDGSVSSILPFADGSTLIAGNFDSISGTPCEKLARLRANGTLDSSFDFDTTGFTLHSANRLRQAGDGSIYFSATITPDSESASITTIFRIDPSGAIDDSFQLPDDLFIESLDSLQIGPDNKPYLAGHLWPVPKPTDFGDLHLARLLGDGSLDESFGDGGIGTALTREFDPQIDAMVVAADGKPVSAGAFNKFGRIPRFNIIRQSSSGSLDHNFTGGSGPQTLAPWLDEGFYHQPIADLALLPNGHLVAGGTFSSFNWIPRVRVAVLEGGPYTSAAVAPDSISATPTGNGGIMVTWDRNPAMTGYLVERQLEGESEWSEVARVSSTWPGHLENLPHGSEASFRVRGLSGTEVSDPSPSSVATAAEPFAIWLESHGLDPASDPEGTLSPDTPPLIVSYSLQQDPGAATAWFEDLGADGLTITTPMTDVLYTIECSNTLEEWEAVTSSYGGLDGAISIDFEPVTEARRYYRLKVQLAP